MRLRWDRHPLSVNNYDPVDIALAISALAVAAGATESIMAASNKPKAPSEPDKPSTSTSTEAAQSAQLEQRKTFLASGGQTDFTGGLGVLTGSDVSKSTLTGN